MTTETQTQDNMTQTMIWLGVTIVADRASRISCRDLAIAGALTCGNGRQAICRPKSFQRSQCDAGSSAP